MTEIITQILVDVTFWTSLIVISLARLGLKAGQMAWLLGPRASKSRGQGHVLWPLRVSASHGLQNAALGFFRLASHGFYVKPALSQLNTATVVTRNANNNSVAI